MYSHLFNLLYYIDEFIRSLQRKNTPQETVIGYSRDLKMFCEYIYHKYDGNILVEHILRNDLTDYLGYLHEVKEYKHASVQRHLSSLKSFYRFLVSDMNFKENVAATIRHQSKYQPLPSILTEQEFNSLLETAKTYGEYFYALVATIYYTGSRITAVLNLKKKHINFDEKVIYFPYIKGGSDLYIPLNDKLAVILKDFINRHPAKGYPYVFHSPRNPTKHLAASSARFKLKKIKESAGIKIRVSPHILRHSMATHLTKKGVDQRFLMEILGHIDPRATTRYQQLDVEDLREPINKL